MPRLTRKAFTDLAIFMMGFGLFMGLIFPPFVVVLGMPQANAFTPLFAGCCIAAGLCVGAINWMLARRIVGAQLVKLCDRMNEVSLEVEKVSQADEWWHADPARWRITAESEDVLGRPAQSFDRLVEALARSLRYENAGRSFAEILVMSSSLTELARAALDCLILETKAPAGAIVSKDGAGMHVLAMHGIENIETVERCDIVVRALESGQPGGRQGDCHAWLAGKKAEIREVYAAPFLYGGEVRGAMLLGETTSIGSYARSVADLFSRDIGLAIANLEETRRGGDTAQHDGHRNGHREEVETPETVIVAA